MPGLTPGCRFQPAYLSFRRSPLPERLVAFVERQTKGLLFGCRMCGNCLLQETAFICPMECPKGLRNGPCGGSTPEGCYVDPSRPCIWHRIYERAERLGRTPLLMEVQPPLDWSRVGHDTWADVVRRVRQRGFGTAAAALVAGRERRNAFWGEFFREIRQPDWWQGDDRPHLPAPHEPVSTLERKLAAGEFVVTAEVAPPLSVAPEKLAATLDPLRAVIDAANFTDSPSATPRMSSLACSAIALAHGVEPVLQIAARDRSRIAVQAEILGAAALGVRNVLCISGDHPIIGPSPHGRMDIWDVDAVQMLWMLRRMRDDGHYLDGREIRNRPKLFLGAAASPSASTPRIQALRELKKSHAGAQFFQSNVVFDVEAFERYLAGLERAGVLAATPFLAGVTPLRSAKMARAMAGVPGVQVPPSVLARLEASAEPEKEGLQIALEIVERVRRLPGVRGIHVMAVGWESVVPRLVREAGLRGAAPELPHE
jgi:5,10-methylenetetrahydrofolate reductase